MNKELEATIHSFTEYWGELSSYWGINQVMGKLYA